MPRCRTSFGQPENATQPASGRHPQSPVVMSKQLTTKMLQEPMCNSSMHRVFNLQAPEETRVVYTSSTRGCRKILIRQTRLERFNNHSALGVPLTLPSL